LQERDLAVIRYGTHTKFSCIEHPLIHFYSSDLKESPRLCENLKDQRILPKKLEAERQVVQDFTDNSKLWKFSIVCYPMLMTLCIKPNLSREKNKHDAIYKHLFYYWSRAVGLWWVYVSRSDVVYSEGPVSGCRREGEKCCFGGAFYLAK